MTTRWLPRGWITAAAGAALAALLAPACTSDELADSLGVGACKDGKCAAGYDCVDGQCVPHDSSSGGTGGGDAAGDGPCAACDPSSCCESQCVDIFTSSSHCGACNAACFGTTCVGGSCTNDCAPGFFDCDGNKANGCEASTACS